MSLRLSAAGLLLATLLLPSAHASDPAPAYKPKINEIVEETQKMSSDPDTVDLVWWIPAEFWIAATEKEDLSEKQRQEMAQLFRDNTVFAVVVGDSGVLGMPKFRSESLVRSQLRLVDPAGREYTPIAADKIDKDLALMVQVFKPILASVIGEMGNNLNFYVFPGKDGGKPVADPRGSGRLVVKIEEHAYPFRLPLGSLMPPRVDTATGEEFPGSYRFNPYTGAELKATQ